MLDIKKLLEEMTLEEKAALCSGADMWHTKMVERLGLPAIKVSDGPHGMRTISEDGTTLKAVCFPTGSALASSYDTELAELVGGALGETAKATGVHTVLGPAVNMKRSPLCGRNFEYLSEDPYLAGEIGSAITSGIQSKGVGACPKHLAANNQEHRRMSISSQVDERVLREIYLPAFERIVKKASPHTIMCSYNRINGTYSCENPWLLTDVLRKEWGFDGIVMTDWAAMNDRPRALEAGLELEMPSSYGENDKRIVAAVKSGELELDVLNQAVERLLYWIDRELEGACDADPSYDMQAQKELARRASSECAVLLENNGILPLKRGMKLAFIGGFAEEPRFQGSGSSKINVTEIVGAIHAVDGIPNITYSEGFNTIDGTIDEEKIAQAVSAASEAEVAVIFAGLPYSFESEGYDRTTLAIPESQNRLIEEVCNVQKNTVVVFHAGSPVVMPWRDKVSALLYMYLGGQCVGEAAVDLLFGDVNPSGKLAETFPLRLEDTPCWLDFPGTNDEVQYSEGVYIGYRWYDKRAIDVQYPFGYGLSYTTFEYMNISISAPKIKDTDKLTVSASVRNTGTMAGHEIVQLYVASCDDLSQPRPPKELKGFIKLSLKPGETKTALFELDKRSFAYYSKHLCDWNVVSGDYTLLVGGSSAELPLRTAVYVESTVSRPLKYTDHMTVKDLRESGLDVDEVLELIGVKKNNIGIAGLTESEVRTQTLEEVWENMPIHAFVSNAKRDMNVIYEALRRIEGLEGKENIPKY